MGEYTAGTALQWAFLAITNHPFLGEKKDCWQGTGIALGLPSSLLPSFSQMSPQARDLEGSACPQHPLLDSQPPGFWLWGEILKSGRKDRQALGPRLGGSWGLERKRHWFGMMGHRVPVPQISGQGFRSWGGHHPWVSTTPSPPQITREDPSQQIPYVSLHPGDVCPFLPPTWHLGWLDFGWVVGMFPGGTDGRETQMGMTASVLVGRTRAWQSQAELGCFQLLQENGA